VQLEQLLALPVGSWTGLQCRLFRQAQSLTQEELARKLGYTRQGLQNIEKNPNPVQPYIEFAMRWLGQNTVAALAPTIIDLRSMENLLFDGGHIPILTLSGTETFYWAPDDETVLRLVRRHFGAAADVRRVRRTFRYSDGQTRQTIAYLPIPNVERAMQERP
jgi:DNA-binding XRE family transcriptional regulator